jgi:hypothetical protein
MKTEREKTSAYLRGMLNDLRNPKKVTGMFVFFCAGDGLLSKAILKFGVWTHAGIGWTYENACADYLEALFLKGIRSPRPFYYVKDWLNEAPKTRKLEIINLPFSPELAERKRRIATTYVGRAGYAEAQLLAMLAFEKWGWRVPKSEGRVVCSEYAARILYPEIDATAQGRTFDEVTPTSLYEILKKQPTPEAENVPLGI